MKLIGLPADKQLWVCWRCAKQGCVLRLLSGPSHNAQVEDPGFPIALQFCLAGCDVAFVTGFSVAVEHQVNVVIASSNFLQITVELAYGDRRPVSSGDVYGVVFKARAHVYDGSVCQILLQFGRAQNSDIGKIFTVRKCVVDRKN